MFTCIHLQKRLRECRAVLREYRALLRECRALLRECRALLSVSQDIRVCLHVCISKKSQALYAPYIATFHELQQVFVRAYVCVYMCAYI